MTLIKTIRVQHIRAHKKYSLDIASDVTVITGPNGSGKTSLVEALYIALRGVSFKGVDNDILERNASWYRVDVTFDDNTTRTVKFDPKRSTGRKQFIVDNKTHYRLPAQHKYPVVLFEPDDLRLLSGSPVRRRQFIDRFIAQLDPHYTISLTRYERALKQRNALLKQQTSGDSLFAWDISLSQYGAYIIDQRIRFISELNKRLNSTYKTISHTNDTITISYSHLPHANTKQKLLSDLHYYAHKDKLLGFTSSGPHRHDILFEFNRSPALVVASRGEVRSVVLALKFLEVEIIESITHRKPVVLLDDVFSELDQSRQKYLIGATKKNQIIITSAINHSGIATKNTIRL